MKLRQFRCSHGQISTLAAQASEPSLADSEDPIRSAQDMWC